MEPTEVLRIVSLVLLIGVALLSLAVGIAQA